MSCFGFASEEAFESANVDEVEGAMENSCWTASLSFNQEGDGRMQAENPDYDEPNCPAA